MSTRPARSWRSGTNVVGAPVRQGRGSRWQGHPRERRRDESRRGLSRQDRTAVRVPSAIYLPQTTYETVFGGGGRLDNIWLRPEPGVDGFELEKKILALRQAPPRRVAGRQARHQLLQHGRARQADQRPVHRHQRFHLVRGPGHIDGRHRRHQQHHDHHGERADARDRHPQGARRDPVQDRQHSVAGVDAGHRRRRLYWPGVWRRPAGADRVRAAQHRRADAVLPESRGGLSGSR